MSKHTKKGSVGKRRKATKTRKSPTVLKLQNENFRLRKKLEVLSGRDFQPDEAYRLNLAQLKKQRKEFMAELASK